MEHSNSFYSYRRAKPTNVSVTGKKSFLTQTFLYNLFFSRNTIKVSVEQNNSFPVVYASIEKSFFSKTFALYVLFTYIVNDPLVLPEVISLYD